MEISPDLLSAISAPQGGQVTLIIGAGCSSENPPGLPLGREMSREVYRRLVADHLLDEGECANPDDLSEVAETVFRKYGGQRELVERLPRERLQNAEANDGYLIAAALLREQAVGNLLTLNFDMAGRHALAGVGAREDVAVIAGPEQFNRLGTVNFVHLHRDVNADPEAWILRPEQLAAAWQGQWEEAITQRVTTVPANVFVGLGSPAGVLIAAVERLRSAIGAAAHLWLVDIGPLDQSRFAEALEITPEMFIQAGWTELMFALGRRLAEEHVAALENALDALEAEGLGHEDASQIMAELRKLTLLDLGRCRALWLGSASRYKPNRGSEPAHAAHLIYALARIARVTAGELRVLPEGAVEFWREAQHRATIFPGSGRGVRSASAVEAACRANATFGYWARRTTTIVLAGGVSEGMGTVAPPSNIVAEPNVGGDIVQGPLSVITTTAELLDSDQAILGLFDGF